MDVGVNPTRCLPGEVEPELLKARGPFSTKSEACENMLEAYDERKGFMDARSLGGGAVIR
jgi:hypothetical protein